MQQFTPFVKRSSLLKCLIITTAIGLAACSQPDAAPLQRAEAVNVQPSETATPAIQTETVSIPTGIEPTRISIPAINVEAVITPVGLLEDGTMEVPEDTDTVGWFSPGTKPGAAGNAVLAGHVDSYVGPAIFFNLTKLQTGDEIIVYGQQDEATTFTVTRKVSYPYDDAPIQDIFGYAPAPRLNLITCTGRYDRKKGTHLERLVVYTEMKK